MEVICIRGYEIATFTGPNKLRPADYPKKGEIYNVTNIMRGNGTVYYFLKEFGNEIVFNCEAFANINNLKTEIDMALKKPNKGREFCRPIYPPPVRENFSIEPPPGLDDYTFIRWRPKWKPKNDLPYWMKAFNDL